jgi:hypothetical protein
MLVRLPARRSDMEQKSESIKDKVTDFSNLYEAMEHCTRGVKWKPGVIQYLQNGLINTYKLQQDVENGTYKIGKKIHFKIYEPKLRDVVAMRFRDRQIERSLLDNYLYHEITRHFIYDNVACQKGKGTKLAIKRLKVMMIKAYRLWGNDYYIAQFDIRHFFGSTLHTIAKRAIRKRVRDDWAVDMVNMLIDSFLGDRGIGLGSDIAQFIELSVLDGMDHYIKEHLHERFYLRYMDDFLIISNDKARLQYDKGIITKGLRGIGLELHPSKTHITPARRGIKWQGYRYRQTETGKIIMTVDKQKIYHERRKLKKMVRLVKAGKLPRETAGHSLQSWRAHAKIGNNHGVIAKMEKYYKGLWEDKNV